jgi:predicted nucleic acid-binding protein
VLYAGDTDKALVLGGLSLLAIGAGVGSGFALVYLGNQHPSGAERVLLDTEQGTAVGVLVVAAVSYVILRVSGLVLAPRTVAAFNAELQERLGIPPAEPVLPTHALAPGLNLKLRF